MLLSKNLILCTLCLLWTFSANSSESTEIWEEPNILISAPENGASNLLRPPVFDSKGNVWFFNVHSQTNGKKYLQSTKWDSSSEKWSTLETLKWAGSFIWFPEITVDCNDNIFVAYKDETNGYSLKVIQHDPNSGWSLPRVLYSYSRDWEEKSIASDINGNIIIIFDAVSFENNQPSIWMVVFNASSKQWSEPQQILHLTDKSLLASGLTLLSSLDRKHIYLIYGLGEVSKSSSFSIKQIYARKWNSSTLNFEQNELVPQTNDVGFMKGAPSKFSGAVDKEGNVTFFWETNGGTLYSSQKQQNVWQSTLMVHGDAFFGTENANVSINDNNEIMGVFETYEDYRCSLYAVNYSADKKWDIKNIYFRNNCKSYSAPRISYYDGNKAVAILNDDDIPYPEDPYEGNFSSLLYDGTLWQTEPSLITAKRLYGSPSYVVSNGDKTVLVYRVNIDKKTQAEISATFMKKLE